jgi:hypothetical protein
VKRLTSGESESEYRETTVVLRNTPTEQWYVEQISERYSFEGNEFNLFCWYVGYRICLENFLGLDRGPPSAEELRAFCGRHKKSQ